MSYKNLSEEARVGLSKIDSELNVLPHNSYLVPLTSISELMGVATNRGYYNAVNNYYDFDLVKFDNDFIYRFENNWYYLPCIGDYSSLKDPLKNRIDYINLNTGDFKIGNMSRSENGGIQFKNVDLPDKAKEYYGIKSNKTTLRKKNLILDYPIFLAKRFFTWVANDLYLVIYGMLVALVVLSAVGVYNGWLEL